MKVAYLFPGQGSQRVGMLQQLPAHPIIAATLAEASQILSENVLLFDSEKALKSTRAVQLALLTIEVALGRLLQGEGAISNMVAGHSVGAFAAAVIADSLSFSQALSVVNLRGRLMEEAYPKEYGMAVVTGLDEKTVGLLTQRVLGREPVYVANINAPDQITIAGSQQGLEEVCALAREGGAQKIQYVNISVPSHCCLLQPVAHALMTKLSAMTVKDGVIPYIGNCRARALRRGEDVRNDLALGVAQSVRWHDMTNLLVELGTTLFIEVGPGQVLTTMVMKAFPTVRAMALENSGFSSARILVQREQRKE